ncbi:hypothetical protein DCAR_0831796 [Daucus carota subsp. sativus]|uniref:Membrane-associated kinase regulator 4 n=1 Tax=Daucus carota subsp. sativus TaxID=79200 RepID=A0A175YMQ9_DAUCS|nr:PREDICTED: probable membrane-associated kinase regulator 4 [Daucus carota subsp. sativus]WOH12294.1 hypothetical protein DCAR_0831796 [Daucus carota subsp. sativus]
MAANIVSCDHADEDYIDMAVSSNDSIFCHAMSSPPHPMEFEFQMFPSFSESDTTTSPADELFYKGKLLPLHLPPRLQMVEKLLQNANCYDKYADSFDEFFSTPLENTTPASTTPFESCNISPYESCQVSRELNPDEYFFEYSTEASDFIADPCKKSWTRKLKLIKQSSIGSKMKASHSYLKSLFNKSGCSNECSAAAAIRERTTPLAKECADNYTKVEREAFGKIHTSKHKISTKRSLKNGQIPQIGGGHHRRSFTGAIKRLSTTKSSSLSSSVGSLSSSSSSTSNGSQESQSFKLNGSSYSDIENSIQSAIAHCKSSQQLNSRKDTSTIEVYSFPSSRIMYEDRERFELCQV